MNHDQTTHNDADNIVLAVVLAVLIHAVLIQAGALFWFLLARPFLQEMECSSNFSQINRNIDWDRINDLGYFPDDFPTTSPLPLTSWRCPVTRAPYVYSPVAPSGERVRPGTSFHFVAYESAPHSDGDRRVLWPFCSFSSLRDTSISWYYQRDVDMEPLTQKELAKENEYRKTLHLAPLNAVRVSPENSVLPGTKAE